MRQRVSGPIRIIADPNFNVFLIFSLVVLAVLPTFAQTQQPFLFANTVVNGSTAALLCVFCLLCFARWQQIQGSTTRRLRWELGLASVVLLFGLLSCGGGSGSGTASGSGSGGGGGSSGTAPTGAVTPSGTYTIIVTPVAQAAGSPRQLQLNPIQPQLTVK